MPRDGRIFCPSLAERGVSWRAAAVDNNSAAGIREVCGTPMALSLVLRAIYFFFLSLADALPHFGGSIISCAFVAKTITPPDLTFSDSDHRRVPIAIDRRRPQSFAGLFAKSKTTNFAFPHKIFAKLKSSEIENNISLQILSRASNLIFEK